MTGLVPQDPAWEDAALAACVFAVDPVGIGGVALRAPAGDVRTTWLGMLRELLMPDAPMPRVPSHIAPERLLGGLDLAATLTVGRTVLDRGLLAQADGGVLVLAMAERIAPATVAHVTAALDRGEVVVERDGVSSRTPSRFGVVALDEGIDDERPAAGVLDRLGIHLDFGAVRMGDGDDAPFSRSDVAAARARLPQLTVPADAIEALCAAALTLGVMSLRAPIFALKVACAAAALAGRDAVTGDDLAVAARLVLSPRATTAPVLDDAQNQPESLEPETEPQTPQRDSGPDHDREDDAETEQTRDPTLDEVVLAAAQAAIPPHLLEMLRARLLSARNGSAGRVGALTQSKHRGRPAGVRRGELRGGARLNLIATLRAAAPWQPLRRRSRETDAKGPRVVVSKEDFRITRFKQRSETATIFVVDASGSAALHRLAEVKGAVELLLADCYVRRDQVALIAFRGQGAEILLPPTRSLTRAKRSLAGLPGGGGTPLAAGIDAAAMLADAVRRKGQTPAVILMTDGRANVARDGKGRPHAEDDAMSAARQFGASGFATLVVDTAPRRQPIAEQLALAMRARYLPLPHADAAQLSCAVKAAGA